MRRLLAVVALLSAGGAPATAAPRASFDCGQARTPVERLICADDTLAERDRIMATAYEALRRNLTPEGVRHLQVGQRAWLNGRQRCLDVAKAGGQAQIVQCLIESHDDRMADIDANFRVVDRLVLEPRGGKRTLLRGQVTEIEQHPWLFGQPAGQADAFNAYVTTRLALDKGLFAQSGMVRQHPPTGDIQFDRSFAAHRFDGLLISILVQDHHEGAVGHGWRSEFALNWDLARGRPVRVTDLFGPDRGWRAAVLAHARTWLQNNADGPDAMSLLDEAALDDDEGWLFDDDAAVLLLGRGERSMVGLSANVPVPYGVLRPFARPDGPLLPPR